MRFKTIEVNYTMKLRDYQSNGVEQLRNGIRTGYLKQMFMLVTGGGKTAVAGYITSNAQLKNKRVWFVVDNLELVEQAVETFEKFNLEVGVIQGIHDKTDPLKPVQVVTAQTLTRRWAFFDKKPELLPDLVFIDEAHVQYKAHTELMNMMEMAYKKGTKKSPVPFIGLSATPFSKGLGKLYDRLVLGADINHLTDLGYLSNTKIYAPYTPSLKGVKTNSNGDWQDSSLEEKMNSKSITADIHTTWKRLGENRQTLIFCVNVAHSKAVSKEFINKGVPTAHIDGYMDKELRAELINKYKQGEIKVLTCITTLTKGFDAPNTGCLVIARPTKSLMLHYQILGRGLRIANGKDECIILDHSGNVQRNGFPDDVLPSELCDGKKAENKDRKTREKSDPLPKSCDACGFLKPAKVHRCPNCDFAPEKQTDIEVLDGELKELKANQKRIKTFSKQQKQEFYSAALSLAKQTNKAEGWASHLYKKYFSVWPNAMQKEYGKVTDEVKRFAKAQAIRYAKGKGNWRAAA